jgi:hypothetical protein
MHKLELDLKELVPLIRYVLAAIIIGLSVMHIASIAVVQWMGVSDEFAVVSLFHLDQEQNFPTFFSVTLLLFCGASVLVNGATQDGSIVRLEPLAVIVALVFLFLALDEFASIHERVAGTINSHLGEHATIPHIWLAPYAILGLPIGYVILAWLGRFRVQLRSLLILSLGVAVAGGFGMEAIAAAIHIGAPTLFDTTISEIALATIEEILELVGFAMFGILLAEESFGRNSKRALSAAE